MVIKTLIKDKDINLKNGTLERKWGIKRVKTNMS